LGDPAMADTAASQARDFWQTQLQSVVTEHI
jgi:hypothetical protein